MLNDLKVKTLYVKFFDVDWDDATNTPVPAAKLKTTNDELPDSIKIIPTVFITNECIQKIDSAGIPDLAIKIYTLIKEIKNVNHFQLSPSEDGVGEIQIDCDWTATTKNKYFKLLQILSEHLCYDGGGSTCNITCTIRLHQIKYLSKTGVPPVSRGLLMCYNMGNLKNVTTKNSIIEKAELKKYITSLEKYPLPLDVGLPVFSWKVLFRKNVYTGLIENLPDNLFTPDFIIKKENRFELLKDTLLHGYDLKKGDVLRNEESNYNEIISTAETLNQQLKNTRLKVSLYHLDSVILNKYSLNELEAIYNSLR